MKIKRIKKKYPTSYLERLRKKTHNSVNGLGIFLLLFLIIGIVVWFIILYRSISCNKKFPRREILFLF